MKQSKIVIYSDGACSGNPGPGGWGSIVMNSHHVTELGGYEPHTTNNRMEILAALRALELVSKQNLEPDRIEIFTDSSYLINAITKWVYGWVKNSWVTAQGEPVKNADLFKKLLSITKSLKAIKIEWTYVPGHKGIVGNERVDEIAVTFSQNTTMGQPLFDGPFESYWYPEIFDFKAESQARDSSSKVTTPKSAKAIGYLAWVNSQLYCFKTWDECARVTQGHSSARYKKFASKTQAIEILKEWGVPQNKIEDFKTYD